MHLWVRHSSFLGVDVWASFQFVLDMFCYGYCLFSHFLCNNQIFNPYFFKKKRKLINKKIESEMINKESVGSNIIIKKLYKWEKKEKEN